MLRIDITPTWASIGNGKWHVVVNSHANDSNAAVVVQLRPERLIIIVASLWIRACTFACVLHNTCTQLLPAVVVRSWSWHISYLYRLPNMETVKDLLSRLATQTTSRMPQYGAGMYSAAHTMHVVGKEGPAIQYFRGTVC